MKKAKSCIFLAISIAAASVVLYHIGGYLILFVRYINFCNNQPRYIEIGSAFTANWSKSGKALFTADEKHVYRYDVAAGKRHTYNISLEHFGWQNFIVSPNEDAAAYVDDNSVSTYTVFIVNLRTRQKKQIYSSHKQISLMSWLSGDRILYCEQRGVGVNQPGVSDPLNTNAYLISIKDSSITKLLDNCTVYWMASDDSGFVYEDKFDHSQLYSLIDKCARPLPVKLSKEPSSTIFYLSKHQLIYKRTDREYIESLDLASMRSCKVDFSYLDGKAAMSPDLTRYWEFYHDTGDWSWHIRLYDIPKNISKILQARDR